MIKAILADLSEVGEVCAHRTEKIDGRIVENHGKKTTVERILPRKGRKMVKIPLPQLGNTSGWTSVTSQSNALVDLAMKQKGVVHIYSIIKLIVSSDNTHETKENKQQTSWAVSYTL